jgi:hypothetical protein
LPMLAVPMMSLVMPAPQAMALVAVPVMGSNLWQVWTVVSGGKTCAAFGRCRWRSFLPPS